MLLSVIFIAVGVIAALLTCGLSPCLSWWWGLLLIPAYYVAAVLVYVIWLFTVILLTDGRNPSPRLIRFYHWCEVHTLSWLMILLGIRRRLEGAEKLPTDRPYLLVCNHRSAFDPIATVAMFKDWNMCFVCKPEIIKVPILGAAMMKAGFFPIDRENPRNAVTAIKHGAEIITEQGRSVGIYPEGTRSKTDDLLPFHAGSFKIAKLADCPIAVASVRVKKGWLCPAAVSLRILEVIDERVVKDNNTAALAQQAEALIRQDLGL